MIEDVARARGCPIVRTKVGQSYAIHALLQEDGVLAGEGSGGVAVPAFHPAFDGFLTIGLVLETMARSGKRRLRARRRACPGITSSRKSSTALRPESTPSCHEVKRFFHHHRGIDTSDGIRVDDKHGWIQVRTSTTEPMIRVVAEDRSPERARRRADEVIDFINGLIQ